MQQPDDILLFVLFFDRKGKFTLANNGRLTDPQTGIYNLIYSAIYLFKFSDYNILDFFLTNDK